jgi:Protein of unknown function (DUF4232)
MAALLAVGGCGTRTQAGAEGTSTRPSIGRVTRPPLPPGPTNGFHRYGGPTTSPPAAPTAPCPASGLRATAAEPDAASGLRALEVSVVNCGATSRTVSGYPTVRVLAAGGTALPVTVHRGASVTTAIDDPAPTTLTLRPGQTALTVLAWRNTVTDSTVDAETGAALAVTVGGHPQVLPVTVDLGNTGRLDVTAWRRPAASTSSR